MLQSLTQLNQLEKTGFLRTVSGLPNQATDLGGDCEWVAGVRQEILPSVVMLAIASKLDATDGRHSSYLASIIHTQAL
jgi:hypothetical protein